MATAYFAVESLVAAGAARGARIGPRARYRINLNPRTNPRVQTIPKGSGRAPSVSPPLLGLPSPRTATQIRNTPGSATGGHELPFISGQWLRGSHGNAGLIPQQIAEQLRGRTFRDFGHFRGEFWKAVGNDPVVSAQFSRRNINRMLQGKSLWLTRTNG